MHMKASLSSFFSLTLLLTPALSNGGLFSTPSEKEKPLYTIEAGQTQQFEWIDDNHFATIPIDDSEICIYAVSSSDKTALKTFDKLVSKKTDDPSPAYQIAISGNQLVALYDTGNVRLWDINTGQVQELWGSNVPNQKEVFFADDHGRTEQIIVQSPSEGKRFQQFSSGGVKPVSSQEFPVCTLWRGKKGIQLSDKKLIAHTVIKNAYNGNDDTQPNEIYLNATYGQGALSHDESTVAVWNPHDESTVAVWNPCDKDKRDTTCIYSLLSKAMINRIKHAADINRVRFTHNNKAVVVSGGKSVSVWSAEDRGNVEENILRTIELDHQVIDAASNPSSSLIAACDRYGNITCWSPEPCEPDHEDKSAID